MSEDRHEEVSDLISAANESVSATYEGVHGHIANSTAQENVDYYSSSQNNGLVQMLDRQFSYLTMKTEEVSRLKVVESQLQSELEKKDEVIQQQATKINDLLKEVAKKDEIISQLRKTSSPGVTKSTWSKPPLSQRTREAYQALDNPSIALFGNFGQK